MLYVPFDLDIRYYIRRPIFESKFLHVYSSKPSDFNLHTFQDIMNLQQHEFNGLALNNSIECNMHFQFHEIKYFIKAANLRFPFYFVKIYSFYEIKSFVDYVKNLKIFRKNGI